MARRQHLLLFLKGRFSNLTCEDKSPRLFILPSIHYRLGFQFLDMDFMDTPRSFDAEPSMSSDTSAARGLDNDNTEISVEVTTAPGSSLQSTSEVDGSWEHQFLWVLGSI